MHRSTSCWLAAAPRISGPVRGAVIDPQAVLPPAPAEYVQRRDYSPKKWRHDRLRGKRLKPVG